MWKASGVVTATSNGIKSTDPITKPDELAEFHAAANACTVPGSYELIGTGLTYPTSKVNVTLTQPPSELVTCGKWPVV